MNADDNLLTNSLDTRSAESLRDPSRQRAAAKFILIHRNWFFSLLSIGLYLIIAAAPAVAQTPGWAYGSFVIRDTYQACLTRANRVLQAEGFSPLRDADIHYGQKPNYFALILCEPPGGSRFSFHIVVSGGAASDPNGVRNRLAALMAQTEPGGSGGHEVTDPGAPPSANVKEIPWSWNAGAAGANVIGKTGQRFTFRCPRNGTPGAVYGTDSYEASGSSICTAAVHAGVITFRDGGIVTIEVRPGDPRYVGSTRNGVTSSSFGSQGFGTFVFVSGPANDEIRLFQQAASGSLLHQIAGLWLRENGSVIEIGPDGTGVFREVSAASAAFGFRSGDTSLSDIRPTGKDVLEASLYLRAGKDECPTLAPKGVPASIRFDSTKGSLSLTAPSPVHSGCRWTSDVSGSTNHTYTRLNSLDGTRQPEGSLTRLYSDAVDPALQAKLQSYAGTWYAGSKGGCWQMNISVTGSRATVSSSFTGPFTDTTQGEGAWNGSGFTVNWTGQYSNQGCLSCIVNQGPRAGTSIITLDSQGQVLSSSSTEAKASAVFAEGRQFNARWFRASCL